MAVMLNAIVPTLVRVTTLAALVVPTVTEPKSKLAGVSLAVVPTPVRGTICGLPLALSVTLSDALRAPTAVGANFTLKVQLAAAAREAPQVCVWEKSPALVPVMAIVVMVNAVVPTFVRVTVFAALVTPVATVPKLKLTGASLAVVPVPLRAAVCGLPVALSATLTDALRAPTAAGANFTLMVHVAAAASEAPHVCVWEKSAAFVPAIVIDVMVIAAVPVFLSVNTFAALVTPVATVPKLKVAGVSVAVPPPPLVLKVAVTALAALMVTEHVPVPVQAPDQLANAEPVPAAAVSVTTVPLAKLAPQVVPQLIPAGLLVTVPVPVPAFVTVNAKVVVVVLNVAVTALAAVIVTAHVLVPVQAPLQPANVEPVPAAAVSVTTVPLAKPALHVVPQLIPAGLLVTVPVPVPALVTVNAKFVVVARLRSHALRPCVPARSVRLAWWKASAITPTFGSPVPSTDQLVPPLLVEKTPTSVPT